MIFHDFLQFWMNTTYYDENLDTNRVLIIISDGEDHTEASLEIAEEANSQGIKIFTVGVGDTKGGPIPLKQNGVLQGYKKDKNGETVITKLDEETLINIAQAANGFYINGTSTQKVVDKIKTELDKLDRSELETKQFADFEDQFQWFLGFGLLFVLIDLLLLDRKTAWLKKLNLFNENL